MEHDGAVTVVGVLYLLYYKRHLWEVVTAVATVWVVFVAYKELDDSNRIKEMERRV